MADKKTKSKTKQNLTIEVLQTLKGNTPKSKKKKEEETESTSVSPK